MDLDKVTYLLALADTKNYSRAAEQCHISQPGILQLNKPIMRYRPNKACFFNVKFFVLYYSILWYFL